MRKRRKKQARRPLTDQQKRAAQLYFDAHKIGEIADIIGVHRTTIWRWFQRKDFRRELESIKNKWISNTRRENMKAWHNSPEYKEQQRRKYAARQKLKKLEKRLSEAGNNGNMKEYRAACRAYDKCFNDAYLGGYSLEEISQIVLGNPTHKKQTTKTAEKPVKYVIEIL